MLYGVAAPAAPLSAFIITAPTDTARSRIRTSLHTLAGRAGRSRRYAQILYPEVCSHAVRFRRLTGLDT